MADMDPEDLSVAIVVNLARFEKSLAGIEASAKRIVNRMEKNLHARIGVQMDMSSAEQSAAVFSRELDKLQAKFDPVFATSKRYEAQVEELARAQQIGALSAQQYARALEALNADFAKQALPEAKTDISTEQLDRLLSKYDPLFAAGQRYKQQLEEINQLQSSGALTGDRYQEALSSIQAEWERANNAASNKMADELERLKLKFDPVYAATRQYETAVEELNRAQQQGAVSADAYAAQMDRLNRELTKRIGGVNADEAQKELERLRLEFDPLYAASKRYEDQFNRLTAAHDKGVLSTENYQRALQKMNAEFAKNSGVGLKTFSSEQLDNLRAKFDPLFAASKQYERQVEELDTALREGALAPRQYADALERINTTFQKNYGSSAANQIEELRREFDHAYTATVEFEAGVERLNQALRLGIVDQQAYKVELKKLEDNRIAYVMEESQKASRRFGMAVQNSSYQIADFAVQVSSGTDAARAFGQQLPQVLGGFGVWGAAAGAAAAILIPLTGYLLKAEDGVKKLDDAFDGASTATNAWKSANDLATTSLAELTVKYGDLAEVIQRASLETEAFARQNALFANQGIANSVLKELGGFSKTQLVLPDGLMQQIQALTFGGTAVNPGVAMITEYERALERLRDKYKLALDSADDFKLALDDLSTGTDATSQLEAVNRLLDIMRKSIPEAELAKMAAETESFYSRMIVAQTDLAELSITLEQRKTSALIAEFDKQNMEVTANTENIKRAYQELAAAQNRARQTGDTSDVGLWKRIISALKDQRGELTLNQQKISDLLDLLDEYDSGLEILGYDKDTEIRSGIQETIDKLVEAIGELDTMDGTSLNNLKGEVDGLTERLGNFLGQIGQTKESLKGLSSPEYFEAEYVRRAAQGAGSRDEELVRAVVALAEKMGLAAKDLLTVISYETGGDIRPDKFGGKNGKYLGLIQFSPENQRKYGVNTGNTITEQVIAAGRYLEDAGVKAGDGLLRIYSAIQTGSPEKWWLSDEKNGGTKGNVRDKVERDMPAHAARAEGMLRAWAGTAKEVEEATRNGEEFNRTITTGTADIRLQQNMLGKSTYEVAFMTKQAELLNDANAKNLPITEQRMRQINGLAEAAANLAYQEERQAEAEELAQKNTQAQQTFADSIREGSREIALQNELLGKNAYDTAYLTTQSQLRNQALDDGLKLTDEMNAQIEAQAVAAGRLAEATEKQRLADQEARKEETERQAQAEKANKLRERLAQQVEQDISRSELNAEIALMSDADQARLIKQFEILQDVKSQNLKMDDIAPGTGGLTWAQYAEQASMAAGVAAEAEQKAKDAAQAAKKAASDKRQEDERALEVRKNLAQQVEEDITRAQFETQIMGMSEGMQARLTKQFEILQELKRNNIDLDEEMGNSGKTWGQWAAEVADATGVAVESQNRWQESIEKSKEKTDWYNNVNSTMKDGLLEAAAAGKSLSEVLDQVAMMLMKAALQAALFNEGPVGVAGAGKGFLGGAFDWVMGWMGLGGANPSGTPAASSAPAQLSLTPPGLGQIASQTLSASSLANINISLSGANGDNAVADIAKKAVIQGLGEYDRRLPGRVREIRSKPRDM